ncbi:MAG: alpha-amylase family glycosyl hydrolase [bacterium]
MKELLFKKGHSIDVVFRVYKVIKRSLYGLFLFLYILIFHFSPQSVQAVDSQIPQDLIHYFEQNHISYQKVDANLIKWVGFYGDANKYSRYIKRSDSEFVIKIVNRNKNGWASAGVNLANPISIEAFDCIYINARGLDGVERFRVTIRDMDWRECDLSQSYSPPLPELGLSKKWDYIAIKLDQFTGDFDQSYVRHIGIEIGTDTLFNKEKAAVLIKDIVFCNQEAVSKLLLSLNNQNQSESADDESVGENTPIIEDSLAVYLPCNEIIPLKDNRNYFTLLDNIFSSDKPLDKIHVFASFSLVSLALFGGVLLRKRDLRLSKIDQQYWVYRYKEPHWKNKGKKEPIKLIYEINTRAHLAKKRKNGKVVYSSYSSISLAELKEIKSLGFDTIWLMGVWEIGAKVKSISKNYGDDYEGSPYAIYEYALNKDLGGFKHFMKVVRNARKVGLRIIVDFVPNHMSLDTPWLNSNPEYFVHFPLPEEDIERSEWDLLHKYPGFYPTYTDGYPEHGKRVRKRIMVAYGRDPNFFPWIDTAQLDYTNPNLRIKMINVLKNLARIVDGVRCDTVMLVLRDQIKNQWNSSIPWEYFNRLFPEEFWLEAFREVKEVNKNFMFIAETYWDKEYYLQTLGFDYTYNKNLYDIISRVAHGGNCNELQSFIKYCECDFLHKSLYFLENHDEERAFNVFGIEAQRAASMLINSLPGASLYHNGQLEGKSERMPVQRVIPTRQNDFNHNLIKFYNSGFEIFQRDCFRKGKIYVLNSCNCNIMSFIREYQDEVAFIAVNMTPNIQRCSIPISQESFTIKNKSSYIFKDLYNRYLNAEEKKSSKIISERIFKGSDLLEKGLNIELEGYKSHIFLIEPVKKT